MYRPVLASTLVKPSKSTSTPFRFVHLKVGPKQVLNYATHSYHADLSEMKFHSHLVVSRIAEEYVYSSP